MMNEQLIKHLKNAEAEMIEAAWALACSGEVTLYNEIIATKLKISALLDEQLARA